MLTPLPPHAAAEELFDKAEAALRRRLAADPRNAAARARLGVRPAPSSRIEPLCGSIVFFPGDCLHEITRVACGAEFGDGRFTVNGRISGVRAASGA